MDRFLKWVAAIVATVSVVGLAYAGWNIRQDGSGETYWQRDDGLEIHVARQVMVGTITDVSTATTHFFVSPITGTITRVCVVLGAAVTAANSLVDVHTGGHDPNVFTMLTPSVRMTIEQSGSGAGDVDCVTPPTNTVIKDSTIAVNTDGGSSTVATLGITVVVEPKR